MSKFLDQNGLLYFWSLIKTKLSSKVDKVTGKALSTNDYTTAEKTKLSGIEANANKYVHPASTLTAGAYGDAGESRILTNSGTFKVPLVKTDANGHVIDTVVLTLTLPAGYTLPVATATALGGVKIGSGLSIANGVTTVTTAPKLAVARTIALAGDVSGSVSFDGSADATITAVIADDSHNHIISNVDGLQTALDTKANATTVKGNADAIALRELLSNKKTTLAENSDVYFPTQQAVNKGLNQTMTEIMGFAPRNLMTVFGTATVAETFAELRARAITGDFRTLRLGDYIDLPSLTIGADSVNPTVYPARTINNNYNQLRVEIVGFDDYLNVGNTAVPTQHHVTMMFKDTPTTAPFNETNITTGDYPGSMLFHWLHEQIEPALISAIGLTPRPVDRIIGTVGSWGWVGSETIFLPTNVNIFGTTGFSHTNYGTGTQTQFALFAMNPNKKIKKRNGSRSWWWLAEPSASSSTDFCYAHRNGNANITGASDTRGVVPAFLI